MYNEQFEDPFLKASEQEYIKKSNHWIADLNCPEYIDRVAQMIALEESNADYWLEPASKPKVMRIVEKQLITIQAEAAVAKQTGCKFMFTHSRLEELAIMYKVFKRDEDSLKHIINLMNPYIVERGEKIVQDDGLLKEPVEFTKKLLELKAEMDFMVEKAFNNDMKF